MKRYDIKYKFPDIFNSIEETNKQVLLFFDHWCACGGRYDYKNKVYMADDRAYAEFVLTFQSDMFIVSEYCDDETQY